MSPPAVPIRGHADVRAVLDDPRFTVPPVRDAAPASAPSSRRAHDLAWLRSTAVRFSNGDEHVRRRSVTRDLLAGLAPSELRVDAAERTRTLVPAGPDPIARPEPVSEAVAFVPVAVLGARLGITEDDLPAAVDAVRTIAAVYLSGADGGQRPHADAAVHLLSALLDAGTRAVGATGTETTGDRYGSGHTPASADREERTAQRIVLLVQSCAATAGLIRSVLALVHTHRASWARTPPVAELVRETLRFDPPARRTRRVAAQEATAAGATVPVGAEIVLDLAAANRDPAVFTDPDRFLPGRPDAHHLAFGHGLRPCPGSDHATALACGVLDTVLSP